MRLSLQIKTSGVLATLQDVGRVAGRAFGIPVGGAADNWSHRLANIALQNRDDVASLELAGGLFSANVHGGGYVAVAGSGGKLYINGKKGEHMCPVQVFDGDELEIKPEKTGCYSYLAVAGGWEAQNFFESKSTCLAAAFGGYGGRALQRGDLLFAAQSFDPQKYIRQTNWHMPDFTRFSDQPVRVLKGPEYNASCAKLFEQAYVITHRRSRMGVQLTAGITLKGHDTGTMISTAVAPGIIQAPPDGQPFVLFADAQTTGGYPRIGQVIAADLPRMAQMPSGASVHFRQVELPEAEQSLIKMQKALAKIRAATRLHSLFLPPNDI